MAAVSRGLFVSFYFLASFYLFKRCIGQQSDVIKWCTTSPDEQKKCIDLADHVAMDITRFGRNAARLECVEGFNKAECMRLIDGFEADLTTFDPGDVFVAGRYHSLIPIMKEIHKIGTDAHGFAVAVIKKDSLPEVTSLAGLEKKKACFPGVGVYGGWVLPIHTLMEKQVMKIVDCNNHVKSAINFFSNSCAIDSLADIYNPLGDNSGELCQLCIGEVAGQHCTSRDPYAGYQGAFKCLADNAGQIAFLKDNTVRDQLYSRQFGTYKEDDFELLCVDGSRRPVHGFKECNWGIIPSDAIATSSAKTEEQKRKYQAFLEKVVELYGISGRQNSTSYGVTDNYRPFNNFDRTTEPPRSYDSFGRLVPIDNTVNDVGVSLPFEPFSLFTSAPKYGSQRNLMFQDDTVTLERFPAPSTERGADKYSNQVPQTFQEFLGVKGVAPILGVRQCPIKTMKLCVTSVPEMNKCVQMKTALKAQLLQPELTCHKAASDLGCIQAIANGVADVAVLDAGDVYSGGLKYELIPILSEVYNLGKSEYYVVAVAKARDPDTELIYLKGKNTCHTGLNHAAGWIIPMAYLLANGRIRSYGCDSTQAGAAFFTKSCVPGALSSDFKYAYYQETYPHLCDLCHGSSHKFCRRDHSEEYFGNSGAFRCLVEGGGHVAFVRHTTVLENTDGKRREYWSRNQLSRDYELLCRDGQRASVTSFKQCNLGRVRANAVVTRGGLGLNRTEVEAYTNLFLYAQQFYGLKGDRDFSLFLSDAPFADLIFQDAAQMLEAVPIEQQNYGAYLGPEFLRARAMVDCTAGASSVTISALLLLLTPIFVALIQN